MIWGAGLRYAQHGGNGLAIQGLFFFGMMKWVPLWIVGWEGSPSTPSSRVMLFPLIGVDSRHCPTRFWGRRPSPPQHENLVALMDRAHDGHVQLGLSPSLSTSLGAGPLFGGWKGGHGASPLGFGYAGRVVPSGICQPEILCFELLGLSFSSGAEKNFIGLFFRGLVPSFPEQNGITGRRLLLVSGNR